MPHTAPPDTPIPDPASAQPTPAAASPPRLPDPQVPLAVWPIPVTGPTVTPAGDWGLPPLLTQRLLAVYTHPGDTVLAAGGSSRRVAATAAELGRRPPASGPGRRPAAGSVNLIASTPTGGQPADLGGYRRWARLLTPTGVLAVVLPPTRPAEQSTLVAAAAVGAGLSYQQHIVAVLWPLHEDHLDPPANPTQPYPEPAGALPPAHADVLIFTAATGEPTPTPTSGTASAGRRSGSAHPGGSR